MDEVLKADAADAAAATRPGIADSDFAPAAWAAKDFRRRVRTACEVYVLRGMHYPLAAYLFHAVKLGVLAGMWMFFVSFTPGLGNPLEILSWIFHPTAFQKAWIWGVCFEVLGFGCMSGPPGLKIV